jgi:hypothetical protein
LAYQANIGALVLDQDTKAQIDEAYEYVVCHASDLAEGSGKAWMILKGNQRAYGKKLALHLLNVDDNEHVTVHELRGFTADDLIGALDEIEAISYGTKVQAVSVLAQSQSTFLCHSLGCCV